MNERYGPTLENFIKTLPRVIAGTENLRALGTAAAEVFLATLEKTGVIDIYGRIDELPEDLLDILAQDLKVDWWDPDYTLDEKRATLKDSWRVRRTLGTPAAVILAISALYPDTQIAEWWEYGGEPYHFKLQINASAERLAPEKHRRVLDRVAYYKNLRSVLDGIEYYDMGGTAAEYACAACVGVEIVDSATAERRN